MTPSDGELVRRIVEHDAVAFEALYARYEGVLRRHLLRMVREDAVADDLLQEVFLRVWRRAHQWSEGGALKPWLFRIATNTALNHLRTVRRRKEQRLEVAAEPEEETDETFAPGWMVDASSLGPDGLLDQVERYRLMWRLVDELPESKREAMRLVYDAGMEIREAAEALGIPEGTVKSRLHHARKRLAQQWEEIE